MKTIKNHIIILILFLPLLSFSQKVENIRFEHAGKEIHIYYDLQGYQVYKVKVYCSTDNGQTWGESLKHVWGEVGLGQIPGNNKMIIWDVLKEKEDLSGNISFKVETSIQRYRGIIPPPPDDDANSYCEYTKNMLIKKEHLDADEYGSWYGEYRFHYGIITEVDLDDDFAVIKIFVVKTSDKSFRSVDGDNLRIYLNYNDINDKTEISNSCMDKLRKMIVPGRMLKFSRVEGYPGCGSASIGSWSFTYLKSLDGSTFYSETQGLYNQNYNKNIKTWQKQFNEIDFTTESIEFLRDMGGKYPSDVYLFDNIIIQERLKKLLGKRYSFLIDMKIEYPISINNNIFIATGCQVNVTCGWVNYMIVVDLSKNIMYVGIREDEKVKLYSEDDSDPPEVLLRWAEED